MANQRGKAIDNTHLSIDTAEERGFLHRDYIAHCFRWSHVVKRLYERSSYKTAKILDIGCGREAPLPKLLYSSRLAPELYIGIDYNKGLEPPEMLKAAKFDYNFYGGISFPESFRGVSGTSKDSGGHMEFKNGAGTLVQAPAPNTIVCFEVVEHVEPMHAFSMLQCIAQLLYVSRGRAFISTPVYDPGVGAAANHVNEMQYKVFGRMLNVAGLTIEHVYGTFASIRDYQREIEKAGPALWQTFNKLREYYDTNVLATIFAPLYPEQSRNCLWEVRASDSDDPRMFSAEDLLAVRGPWTSSEKWAELETVLK